MKPVTDKYHVSKEKLAYLIDSTAAPICIIAPISSWAAAVSGFVAEGENGIALFCKSIGYNYYALFTIVMIFVLVFMKFEYGPMAKYEKAAEMLKDIDVKKDDSDQKGSVLDLVIPIAVLIIMCVLGMIYSGGFFTKDSESYLNFIEAFANCDASVGLVMNFLPAIVFVIAIGLAFATGTSWGTFGILIPICIAVFPNASDPLRIICISACMAGAVCGDHCSPISDTTIMASAGAQCNHVNHVSTQLPYAITVAVVSFISFVIAGFTKSSILSFVVGVVLLVGFLFFMKKTQAKKVIAA